MSVAVDRKSQPAGESQPRVLHLFSNCKWTGPAEPALHHVVALRRAGVPADFACAPDAGKSVNRVVTTARDRGVEPVLTMHLRKHRHPWYNWMDVRTLRRLVGEGRYSILHSHLSNDHGIAARVARNLNVPLVRTSYEGEGLEPAARYAPIIANTAHLIEPSERARIHDQQTYHLPDAQVSVLPGPVDTERFDPARPLPDGRRRLNLPPDAFVVGIVARMQRHRRFEIFFEAISKLVATHRNVYVVVVGRGTYQEQVGWGAVRARGLQNQVKFAGYLEGEDYVGMVRALDAKVLMVPGSDGTCRAVREAMALARPCVVGDTGMLPEIVRHGEHGLVFDNTAIGLYNALADLAKDKARARNLGWNAREHAVAQFSLDALARNLLTVYRRVLGKPLEAL